MEIIQILSDKFKNMFHSQTIEKNYKSLTEPISLTCFIHGITVTDTPANLLYKTYPCPECARENSDKENEVRTIPRKKREVDEVIAEFRDLHGDRFDYSLVEKYYKNMKSYVWIYCKKHDLAFQQTPINHLNSKQACPKCLGELRSEQIKRLNTPPQPN